MILFVELSLRKQTAVRHTRTNALELHDATHMRLERVPGRFKKIIERVIERDFLGMCSGRLDGEHGGEIGLQGHVFLFLVTTFVAAQTCHFAEGGKMTGMAAIEFYYHRPLFSGHIAVRPMRELHS